MQGKRNDSIGRQIKEYINKLERAGIQRVTRNAQFFWPGPLSGFFGISLGAALFGYLLVVYLPADLSPTIFRTVWLVLCLLMAFICGYFAGAHAARLIGIIFTKLLGPSAQFWAIIPALIILLPLFFSFGEDREDTRYAETGGLAFLASDSVSRVDVTIAPMPTPSSNRLVSVDIKVTAEGDASLAVIGSGPAEFDSASLKIGSMPLEGVGDDHVTDIIKKRTLPLVNHTFKLSDSPDLIEAGDSGMYVTRDDSLAPEMPGQWFSADTARSFSLELNASPGELYERELSFILRLRTGLTIELEEGNLGEVGCPSALVSASEKRSTERNANRLFILRSAKLPLTAPELCNVRLVVAQVTNSSVRIAGQDKEIDVREPLVLSDMSRVSDSSENLVLINELTLPRSDWRIDDRKNASSHEEAWRIMREASMWALGSFVLLQTGRGLLTRLRRAARATNSPSI